jgi:predicted anti-sigma-YlaC factor YlaD
MDCSKFREALSARFDGEPLGVDEEDLDRHLQVCPSCRRFEAGLPVLARASRIAAAERIPDRTSAILAMARTPTGTRLELIRALLVGLGVLEVANGISSLMARSLDGAAIHQSRELGAFAFGIGVALLVAVVRPRILSGLFPVLGVLALGSVITAGFDIASGQVSLTTELHHLIEVTSVLTIWLLSRVHPRPRPSSILAS